MFAHPALYSYSYSVIRFAQMLLCGFVFRVFLIRFFVQPSQHPCGHSSVILLF